MVMICQSDEASTINKQSNKRWCYFVCWSHRWLEHGLLSSSLEVRGYINCIVDNRVKKL